MPVDITVNLQSIFISIVVSDKKASAVAGALKGHYLKSIILDEITAREVLQYF